MSDHLIGETGEFGDWATIYEGIGLSPQDLHDGLMDLVGQAGRYEADLPEQVREDVEAVLAEIEEGRGRSREVSMRLERIRRACGPTTSWAAVGRAATVLLGALGLKS